MIYKNDINEYDTIFLDRDGVINLHRPNDYVKHWDEFVFTPNALEALRLINQLFKQIVIVTNQRGVGKGLMTEAQLNQIHKKMVEEIILHGGRIDKIYYCVDLEENSENRKPNVGMALQAKKDFPEIDFHKSIMIGDSQSDMEFGNRLGMRTFSTKDENFFDVIKKMCN